MHNIFVFDLDGTLVNTDSANFYAYQEAIREYKGINISVSQNRFTRSDLEILFPNIRQTELKKIIELKEECFKYYLKYTTPNTYFIEKLQELSHNKQECILLTSAHRRRAVELLEYYNLKIYFTKMYFHEDYNIVDYNKFSFLFSISKNKEIYTIYDNTFDTLTIKIL
ncbi:MAG: HAD hydrolase-like protein [Bacteroidales bacterium]|nr:HAD hydrolase-like protein [Bacteroidales bacterium]MEE3412662.1 HAD hydrolase-like protein [Bacteroidales bacterium]